MKLQNLLNEQALIIESHMTQSRKILRESCEGLTREQHLIVEGIYNDLRPLIEASLTADQIKQVFGTVEKQAIEKGDSRTLVGKGVDVTKKANEIINTLGAKLQDTAPVKAFDQKFEQLKAKVAAKFPDLAKQTAGLGEWVKANPGKSAAVIGVLTALASLAGGPVGGAIAGQVLRGASELLKGEKLSTAIGKGIKTAALGYLSGKAFEVIGKYVAGMRADSIPFGPEDAGLEQVSYGATRTLTAPGLSSKETLQGFKVIAFPQEAEGINAAMNMIRNGEAGGFDALQRIAREIQSPEYKAALKDIMVNARADQLANDGLTQWINGMATAGQALSQGAVAAAGEKEQKKENYYVQHRPLSEGQVYLLFNRLERLDEGPMDLVKKGAGAVAKGASWLGKQATEKLTSAKLFASWKLEGSPTDSEELAKFLKGQGVSDDIVKQVYTDMKLPEPGSAATGAVDVDTVKQQLTKLRTREKIALINYMTKTLKVA